jgi:hypothetical protein
MEKINLSGLEKGDLLQFKDDRDIFRTFIKSLTFKEGKQYRQVWVYKSALSGRKQCWAFPSEIKAVYRKIR